MNFDRIVLENFGPYKGTQHIEFPVDNSKNVTLILGDNMRGKTSILNAFRWALYSEALDRAKNKIDVARLLNLEARNMGDTRLSVEIQLTYSRHTYTLLRVAKPFPGISVPKSEQDMDIEFSILRDGTVLKERNIPFEINSILPKAISRFCLFDGELLKEYEALLSEEKDQARTIRESIEKVLGVPSLINGMNELKTLAKKAQREQAKASDQVKALKDQSRHLQSLIDEREKMTQELDSIRDEIQEINSKIAGAEDYLKTRSVALRRNSEREGYLQRLQKLRDARHDKQIELQSALGKAWIDVLQPMVEAHISELERRRSALTRKLKEQGALEEQLRILKELSSKNSCPFCAQVISRERKEELLEKRAQLEIDIESYEDRSRELNTIGAKLETLRSLQRTGALESAAIIESDLAKIDVEETDIEGKLNQLNEALRGFDPDEAKRQEIRKRGYTKELGSLETSLKKLENDLENKDSEIQRLSQMLSNNPKARAMRESRLAAIYSSLTTCFRNAVGILRDDLREKVSECATEIFLALTTEKNYSKLSINENYGLNIVTKEGTTVDLRSAGAEQIVALSLIAGLNAVSEKGLPMIMDTPLGRLDIGHRDNVLQAIPQIAPQVVLLAHSGEILPEMDVPGVEKSISARYRIKRVSEFHSELDRIQ